MPFFKYVAKDRNNKTVTDIVEESSRYAVIESLRARGYKNIKITIDKKRKVKTKISPLSLKEKIDFTQTFQTLNKAGVPIIESLVFLGNEAASARIRNMATVIRQEILDGGTFAGTIAKYPNIFDRIYAGLVKAGEDSGEMEKTLTRLADLLKKQSATKGKVISALLYPVFVVVLAFIIVIVMVVFVFPKFAETFAASGKELPPITQMCISLGNSIINYWYLYIIFSVGSVWLAIKSFQWPATRAIIDKYILKVPLVNNLILQSNFSNFLTVLLVAYNAGVPIVDCVYLSNLTLTNGVLKNALNQASLAIQQGAQLSLALKNTAVVPKMVIFMISTGEQSGRLGELLENAVSIIVSTCFWKSELCMSTFIVGSIPNSVLLCWLSYIGHAEKRTPHPLGNSLENGIPAPPPVLSPMIVAPRVFMYFTNSLAAL